MVLARLVGVSALLLIAGRAVAEPAKRTLPELLKMARERAPQVAIAEASVAVRRAQKIEALGYFFPSGELTYGMYPAPELRCFDGAGARSTADCQTTNVTLPNSFNNISSVGMQLEARLTQPLFTFGKIRNASRAAEHGVSSARAQLEMAKLDVELLVARAYWGWKAARTSLATLRAGRDELLPWVEKIERDLDEAKPQFTVNDLQRIKVALAQVDIFVADLERNELIARAGMRALLHEEVEIDDAELDPVAIVDQPIDYYRAALRDRRPEVRALDEGVKALQALARVRRAEMLPDVGLVSSITWRYAPSIDSPQNAFLSQANGLGFGLSLGIRQPLDLVLRYGVFSHAGADVALLEAQRSGALLQFEFEVAQGHANLVEARRRLDAAERGQKYARGWLTAIQQNLDLGTGESRDLIDAARGYFELRLRYYQAIHDVNVATAQLRRSSGIEVASPQATTP
ncbi:MAG: TolC family protein [Myxococcales bacterium]|nr:TolC family protein [Myxococcales bacterium]